MKKLLCIVGPTATGKTALAIKLSLLFPSVLISADSRQVYQGMDIVTGKDQPVDTPLYGIDLVSPDEDCSVAVWQKNVEPYLNARALPIVVGGTGLYVKSLINPIKTINIKPDYRLRDALNQLSADELRAKLKKLDLHKLESMNNSDINNPRRLIRAIEVASITASTALTANTAFTYLIVGLHLSDTSTYESRVRKRVMERIDSGAIAETETLLKTYSPTLPSMSALGYKHIISFLKGQFSKEQLIDNWTRDEVAYAKRQMTWFHKMENIHWFDVNDNKVTIRVEELVKNWYYET